MATPRKSNIDPKNEGLEDAFPFNYGNLIGICDNFLVL